jgi:hypothetical protein
MEAFKQRLTTIKKEMDKTISAGVSTSEIDNPMVARKRITAALKEIQPPTCVTVKSLKGVLFYFTM